MIQARPCRECRAPVDQTGGSRNAEFCGGWCASIHREKRLGRLGEAKSLSKLRDTLKSQSKARRLALQALTAVEDLSDD